MLSANIAQTPDRSAFYLRCKAPGGALTVAALVEESLKQQGPKSGQDKMESEPQRASNGLLKKNMKNISSYFVLNKVSMIEAEDTAASADKIP